MGNWFKIWLKILPNPSPYFFSQPYLDSLSVWPRTGCLGCQWCWCSPGPGWAAEHTGICQRKGQCLHRLCFVFSEWVSQVQMLSWYILNTELHVSSFFASCFKPQLPQNIKTHLKMLECLVALHKISNWVAFILKKDNTSMWTWGEPHTSTKIIN